MPRAIDIRQRCAHCMPNTMQLLFSSRQVAFQPRADMRTSKPYLYHFPSKTKSKPLFRMPASCMVLNSTWKKVAHLAMKKVTLG